MRISSWLYIFEQMSMTCCLLLTIGFSAGLRRKAPVRLLLVSAAASLLSMGLAEAPGGFRAASLLCCAVGCPLLAWPGAPSRIWPRMIASGCFLSMGITGVMRFMAPFGWPTALVVLMVCGLLQAVPVVLPKPEEIPRLATVDIRHGAHHLTLTALIDSGNLLRDGVTGLSVIIISRRAAQRLVQLPQQGSLTYPFRLLTVRTVSGTAMMTVFHPDSVYLLKRDGWQRTEALLGVSPEGYDGFQALVPASLMQTGGYIQADVCIPESEIN